MFSSSAKYISILLVGLIINFYGFSQVSESEKINETLEGSINILKKYFYEGNNWHVAQPSVNNDVRGLINFIEDEPIDSILNNLNRSFSQNEKYVIRLPENVSDSLNVPGYYSYNKVEKEIENIGIYLQEFYRNKKIVVPVDMISDLDNQINLISEGKGMQLFIDSIYTIPEYLQIPEVIPDSLLNSPEDFKQLVKTDSLRNRYIEQKRLMYNDSITSVYIDSVIIDIRNKQFSEDFNFRVKNLSDSVKINNYQILKSYNDLVISAVNDSIYLILKTLLEYADYIDTTHISIINLTGDSTDIYFQKGIERFERVWLKNEQNDSLSILVKNRGKRSMQMLIDDGVTFSRYKPKETKHFNFRTLEKDFDNFAKVGNIYEIETPWKIGGVGNVGLTQTYLQNWKKGGQSSIAMLMVLKGFANYSRADGKIRWENSAEIRNGWIRPGGQGSEIQKNDDRFEFTSRYSVSAFSKWFYSAELNFETQFFKGFQYPTEDHPDPISGFMAPSKTFIKVGLEYNPNKEFSMLLSPFTLKNVFVRDTTLIDQTKFGVEPNRKSFWEPGLNADLKFKTKITDDISYQTKYKMFINYKEPFRKFDINWENLFIVKLNDYFNVRLMVHFIYDDNVLFPLYDDNDVQIGEEPKLQIKELMTIGFAYKINRNVMKSKRIR
ncbi:MAG: DUF3078 domain-containing protein [Draconibacterium sp.]|nr:DUF3078 domain-containing protein [Draconibacterium sp.]